MRDLAALFLRIVSSSIFIFYGWPKLFGDPTLYIEFFGNHGFPYPAYFVMFSGILEVFGGLFLLVGLATRFAAVLLSIEMLIANIIEFQQGFTVATQLTALLFTTSLSLAFLGGGRISLGYILAKKWKFFSALALAGLMVVNFSQVVYAVSPPPPSDTTAPASVTNLATGSPGQTSMPLTWTAPGDDGNTGTATSYDVRYSTSNITDSNWSSATQASGEPAPQVAGSAETFTVTGLSASTTYYFALKTSDEVPNVSGLSNVVSQSTSAAPSAPSVTTGRRDFVSPAYIIDLVVSNITDTSLTLAWTAPGDDGDFGTAAVYDIRYSINPIVYIDSHWIGATEVKGEPSPRQAGSKESMKVSDLQSNTTYYFVMKTYDGVFNASFFSNVVTVTTKPPPDITAPSAIGDLAASDPTSTSIKLSWTASGDDGASGTAALYDIRYSTFSEKPEWFANIQAQGESIPAVAGTKESFVIPGLLPQTTYYFGIKVLDEAGNESLISNIVSVTTLAPFEPPAPEIVVKEVAPLPPVLVEPLVSKVVSKPAPVSRMEPKPKEAPPAEEVAPLAPPVPSLQELKEAEVFVKKSEFVEKIYSTMGVPKETLKTLKESGEIAVDGNKIRKNEDVVQFFQAKEFIVEGDAYVESNEDLVLFAAKAAYEDENIKYIKVSENEVSVRYSGQGRLFGFIPIRYTENVAVEVREDAIRNVEIKLPWWHVFTRKQISPKELKNTIQDSFKKKGTSAEQAFFELARGASQKANILDTIWNTLKSPTR